MSCSGFAGNGGYVRELIFFYGAEYVRVVVINRGSTVFFVRSIICVSVGICTVSAAPTAIIFSSLMKMTWLLRSLPDLLSN